MHEFKTDLVKSSSFTTAFQSQLCPSIKVTHHLVVQDAPF